jgi:Kef-type K+ transport system membrane component KefB
MRAGEGTALIAVTTGAVVLPGVARRLGVPVAVAEIVFGVLVGQSGLGLGMGPDGEIVRALADLGLALFLFVAGMELDVGEVERHGPRVLAQPLACNLLTMATALGIARIVGLGPWLGLAAGATSVPLMLSVLRELGLARAPVGRRMLTIAGIGELASIALVGAFEVAGATAGAGPGPVAGRILLALLPVVATVVAVVLLRTLLWWYPGIFLRFVAVEDPQELGMRAGVGLLALFVGIAAVAGVEPMLGAFVAGLVVSSVLRDRGALETKLASMAYGFFVPIFFIQVGMRVALTPADLARDAGLIATMLAIVAGARLPAVAVLAATGFRFRDAVASGLLLSAPLTMLVAIADLGARSGGITPRTEASAVAVAMLASIVFPGLARRVLRSARAIGAPSPS